MIAAFIAQGLSADEALLLAGASARCRRRRVAEQQATIGMSATEVTEVGALAAEPASPALTHGMTSILYRYLFVVVACISLLIGLQIPNFVRSSTRSGRSAMRICAR